MKIECMTLLVLAVMTVSGCTTSSPAVTPTVTAAPATSTPVPPTPTATSAASGGPASASVTISGFAFQPAEVTIAKGGTVTWTNNDGTAHTVKFPDSESPVLQNGMTYNRTFGSPGTFDYACGIHTYMKGRVTVA